MPVKLFRDTGKSLTHRDLDDNFASLQDKIDSLVSLQGDTSNSTSVPQIVIGPTMTKSMAMYELPNTRKFIGMRPQSGEGVNYTYAKDANVMFRKSSNNGGYVVDDNGNSLRFINIESYKAGVLSADGKWMVSVLSSYSIYVTNMETNQTIVYSSSSFWSKTHVTEAGGCIIDGEDVYIPGYYVATYYIMKCKLDLTTGVLTPVEKYTTGRSYRSSYNAYGEDQIAMSDAGDITLIHNVKTRISRTLSHPTLVDGLNVGHMPIGFGLDGKAHFIRCDRNGGSVNDILNIYIEENGVLAPHAVSQQVSNELAAFGEMYSYNWPKTYFALMSLESGPVYASYINGSDQSATAFYNPETLEFVSLSDHNEALFIKKGA